MDRKLTIGVVVVIIVLFAMFFIYISIIPPEYPQTFVLTQDHIKLESVSWELPWCRGASDLMVQKSNVRMIVDDYVYPTHPKSYSENLAYQYGCYYSIGDRHIRFSKYFGAKQYYTNDEFLQPLLGSPLRGGAPSAYLPEADDSQDHPIEVCCAVYEVNTQKEVVEKVSNNLCFTETLRAKKC